jgi:beta-N-acetylhexosaminidase
MPTPGLCPPVTRTSIAMSLDRLALAVQLPAFRGPSLSDEWHALLEEGLGGVCLFGSNLPFGPLVSSIRAVAPNAVVATDEEGGDVTRLHCSAGSPMLGHAALGSVDDPSLTRDTAAMIGTSLRDVRVDLNFGPVADVNSNPLNPVIGSRSFGASVVLVARHVEAYVEGLQSAGVSACAKHFPGHGDTHEDSHLALPTVERAPDLAPFAAAVEAGAAAVMTSHIVVASVDAERPATLSPDVLGLLRSELGFEGVVVSDALDMAGASAGRGIPAAAVSALAAGCDLLCLGPDKDAALVREVQAAIVAAVKDGALAEERLAEAAARVAGRPRLSGVSLELDAGRQVAGARAAIRVDGVLPDLTGAILLRAESERSIAVGTVPWGIPCEAIDPATFDAASCAPVVSVVLQTRDAHRHPAVLALVERLPRVVVVDYGWPGPWPLAAPRICAHGASLPARAAVAELLQSAGWTR